MRAGALPFQRMPGVFVAAGFACIFIDRRRAISIARLVQLGF
jgi:hypothetical protein